MQFLNGTVGLVVSTRNPAPRAFPTIRVIVPSNTLRKSLVVLTTVNSFRTGSELCQWILAARLHPSPMDADTLAALNRAAAHLDDEVENNARVVRSMLADLDLPAGDPDPFFSGNICGAVARRNVRLVRDAKLLRRAAWLGDAELNGDAKT